MFSDYQLVSPSLDGILSHSTLSYENIVRPIEITRIFDRPTGYRSVDQNEIAKNKLAIERYFQDLFGVLMKKITQYAIQSEPSAEETVMLTAMLQEFVKVKKLLATEDR